MKKISFAFFLVLYGLFIAEAQQKIWQRQLGGSYADYLSNGIRTLDNGFIMIGGSISKDMDVPIHFKKFDAFMIKVREDGSREWKHVFGGEGNDYFRDIIEMEDGGYLVVGSSDSKKSFTKKSHSIGNQDIWLVRLNIKGDELWQMTIGGERDDYPVKVLKSKDGGIIIGAVSNSEKKYSHKGDSSLNVIYKKSPVFGSTDYWVMKLDKNGKLLWEKDFGGIYSEYLTDIVELPDGSLIIGGYSNSPLSGNKGEKIIGGNDWWILKLSPEGNVLWQRVIGKKYNDELLTLSISKEGDILAGGFITLKRKGGKFDRDIYLLKLSGEGEEIWHRQINIGTNDNLTDILVEKDGSILLGGYITSLNKPHLKMSLGKGMNDFLLMKMDRNGHIKWRKWFPHSGDDEMKKIISLRDGGYVLMGTTIPFNSKKGNTDFLIMKIADKDKGLKKLLPLEAIPNPVIDYTRIVIGADYQKGYLILSDLHGHILVEKQLTGSRIIPLSLSTYRPGIYIIQVMADEKVNSIKVIKQK